MGNIFVIVLLICVIMTIIEYCNSPKLIPGHTWICGDGVLKILKVNYWYVTCEDITSKQIYKVNPIIFKLFMTWCSDGK